MKHLRPYQKESADRIQAEWQDNDSTLLVLPTGCGKTIVFAEVIRRLYPKRALVCAHREELIFQARDKIERFTGIHCEIEMADRRADNTLFARSPVVISTIQTQIAGRDGNRRMNRFRPSDFGLLIIDEGHHAPADSYKQVIEYYRQNPNLKVLGVTATPDRFDEKALGQIFQSVAFDYEILDAINDGWLVPVEQQFVHVKGLDFSQVRLSNHELNGQDLAQIMEDEQNLQGMTASAIEIIGSRKTLVFTSSVRHAEMTANLFNRHRDGMAQWASADTDSIQRQTTVSRFAKGEFQVLVNCALFLEGFDDPSVEVIVMGRPTCSRSLYAQMAGRATRPLPGIVDGENLDTPDKRRAAIAASAKTSCLLVDYVGNSGRFKLMTSADILGGKYPDEVVARATAKALSAKGPTRMGDLLEKSQAELEAERIAAEKRRLEEAARRAHLIPKATFLTKSVSPFEILNLRPVRARGWDEGKKLSEPQQQYLQRRGIDPTSMPYHEGKQLVDELHRREDGKLCTLEQVKKLKAMGLSTDMDGLKAAQITKIPCCTTGQARVIARAGKNPLLFTVKTASIAIDWLGKNGWKWGAELDAILTKLSVPQEPVFMGDRLSEKEVKFLAKYHYPMGLLEKVHKDEGRRLKLRIIKNGFKPLLPTDPDHPKNWKPS